VEDFPADEFGVGGAGERVFDDDEVCGVALIAIALALATEGRMLAPSFEIRRISIDECFADESGSKVQFKVYRHFGPPQILKIVASTLSRMLKNPLKFTDTEALILPFHEAGVVTGRLRLSDNAYRLVKYDPTENGTQLRSTIEIADLYGRISARCIADLSSQAQVDGQKVLND
jgi:hypothetical protein